MTTELIGTYSYSLNETGLNATVLFMWGFQIITFAIILFLAYLSIKALRIYIKNNKRETIRPNVI